MIFSPSPTISNPLRLTKWIIFPHSIAKHFGISIGDVNSIFAAYNISGRPAKKKKYKLEINENGDPVLNENNAVEEELEQLDETGPNA